MHMAATVRTRNTLCRSVISNTTTIPFVHTRNQIIPTTKNEQLFECLKPLYVSNGDKLQFSELESMSIFKGYPISQFIIDTYTQFVIKNPEKRTIDDFMRSSEFLSAISHDDTQYQRITKHLKKYIKDIAKPIHRDLIENDIICNDIDEDSFDEDYDNIYDELIDMHYTSIAQEDKQVAHGQFVKNSQLRILYYTERIQASLNMMRAAMQHQLDVYFIPKLLDEINSEYFQKHNIQNYVKWKVKDSTIEYGKKSGFAGYDKKKMCDMHDMHHVDNIYELLRAFYDDSDLKRYVMLITSKNIYDVSMDEIILFEPTDNELPNYNYTELPWICNTKQSLPNIEWHKINPLCLSFHTHQDVVRVYFSTILPNKSYHSTRVFKHNMMDIIAPFCVSSTKLATDYDFFSGWHNTKFIDPEYDSFVNKYFSDLQLQPQDSEIESLQQPPEHDNDAEINTALSQKSIEDYEALNRQIHEYYKSENSKIKYNDQFLKYINDNDLSDVPLSDNLASNIDPDECVLLGFDQWFPINSKFIINDDTDREHYIFYVLQCCYIYGKIPDLNYMIKKMPHLIRNVQHKIAKQERIQCSSQHKSRDVQILSNQQSQDIVAVFADIDSTSNSGSSGNGNAQKQKEEDRENRNNNNNNNDNDNNSANNHDNNSNGDDGDNDKNKDKDDDNKNKKSKSKNKKKRKKKKKKKQTKQEEKSSAEITKNTQSHSATKGATISYNPPSSYTTSGKFMISRKLRNIILEKTQEKFVDHLDLLQYMDKKHAMQFDIDKMETFNTDNEEIKIINYGFHEKKTIETLYCVAKPTKQRDYSWKLENRLFSTVDLCKEYGINEDRIPKTARIEFMDQLQHSVHIKQLITNSLEINGRINKIPWHKLTIFNKKNKHIMMRLDMSKQEFIKNVSKYLQNKPTENNTPLIPIIMFNDKNKHWIEHIWIVKLMDIGVDIGISFKYNEKNGNIQTTGIHLDKHSILVQHKLVDPCHECHCLDNFHSNISDLTIFGSHIGEQHTNSFKNFVQEFVSETPCDGNEQLWRQKALKLLQNDSDDILQKPIIATSESNKTPSQQTVHPPNTTPLNIMPTPIHITPTDNNSSTPSAFSNDAAPNITASQYIPNGLPSVNTTTPGFNIIPHYPINVMPMNLDCGVQSINPSIYHKYYPPILPIPTPIAYTHTPMNNYQYISWYPPWPSPLYPYSIFNTV